MADVISALLRKRCNLAGLRSDIQREAGRKVKELNEEIARIDAALKTLEDAAKDYLCPRCKGSGEERRSDAAGQMESYPCPDCKGTGVRR